MADKLSGQAADAPPADARSLIARHQAASEPAWLWDLRRSRIVWGNAAAVTFWEAGSTLDLIEYRFLAGSPEAALGNGLAGGGEREAVLAPSGVPLRAHLHGEAAVLFDGSEGVLVRVLDTLPEASDPVPARRASLFDAAPVALLVADAQGSVREANKAAREFAGGFKQDDFARLVRQALTRGSANRSLDVTIGREVRSLRLYAERSEDAGEPCALIRVDDVTDRRALESEWSAAPVPLPVQQPLAMRLPAAPPPAEEDEARSRLVANLSHEMRNPLTAILGFAEIMQQRRFGPLGNHRYEGYVDDIRASAGYLLDLVNDLLDMGKLNEGRFKVDFESVSLPAVAAECERMLAHQAAEGGVNLSVDLPDAFPPVVADARVMKQILVNVMSNAVKFTPDGGEVRVSGALDPEGGVALIVSDSGIGMSADELASAMEPYGQIDGEIQRKRKGTGLGLPLAKALAEANKCAFSVTSAPGRGTEVKIAFPSARVLAG